MKSHHGCCREYMRLFAEYVDSELSEDKHRDFKNHIESCDRCWTLFRTYNLTVRLSRKTRQVHTVSAEQVKNLCALLQSKMAVKK